MKEIENQVTGSDSSKAEKELQDFKSQLTQSIQDIKNEDEKAKQVAANEAKSPF